MMMMQDTSPVICVLQPLCSWMALRDRAAKAGKAEKKEANMFAEPIATNS